MRALRIHAYGPAVMRLDEVPLPQAQPGERLVKLAAASVNPIDWKMRQGLMSAIRSARVLKPGGALTYLNALPVQQVLQKGVRVMPSDVRPARERLDRLLKLGLRIPVEMRFPLDKGAQAHELSRGGHVRGKIVL